VVAKVDVGGSPCGVVGARGAVWVTDADGARLLRVDPRSGKVTDTYKTDPSPCELVFAHGSLWVVTQSGVLDRVDPATGKVTPIEVGATSYEPLSAFGAIWVSNRGDGTVSKVDPGSNKVVSTVELPGLQPGGLVAAGGSLWVGNDTSGTTDLARVDPQTSKVTGVTAGGRPAFVTAAAGSVFVANENDGTVTRLDEVTGKVSATVSAGVRPVNLAALAGDVPEVWVPDDEGDTLTRIDATTGDVIERIASGDGPAVVTAIDGDVWVTNFGDGSIWRIRPGAR
jgi:virginiamycin B lyase